MTGCLEGYNAVARHLFAGVNQSDVLEQLAEASKALLDATPEPTPWIFYSSTNPTPIITMKDAKFSTAPAMATGDGKIVAVGTYEEAKAAAGPNAQEHDLKSRVVVPGFIEPHLHTTLSAMVQGFLTNCDPLNPEIGGTFHGTIKFIKNSIDKITSPDQWFLGYGYDPSRLEVGLDGKFRDLTFDTFAEHGLEERPIFIINASAHLAYANRKAFTLAGVPLNSPNEHYVKDAEGNVNGIMIEPPSYQPFLQAGFPTNLPRVPLIVEGLLQVVNTWSSKGFTTIFDAGIGQTGKLDVPILSTLAKVAPLHITGAAADLIPGAAVKVVGEDHMPTGGMTDLNIKTIKLWMDGSTQGFTAALEQPYEPGVLPAYFKDEPNGWAGWKVGPKCPITDAGTNDIVKEMLVWAQKGYQLMVHANGDCASQVVLDAYATVVAAFPPKAPVVHRIEHFTVTTPQQVQRAKELGLSVSHTIGHVRYWGHTFQKYILGADRADRIDPVRDDVENGLLYSFHSDSPVSQADALSYVHTAATRLMYHDFERVLGQDQTVSVEAALAGVTINPAVQILRSSEVGSLEVGKCADFVVLEQDISADDVAVKDIGSEWVLETWFNGVKRYQKINPS